MVVSKWLQLIITTGGAAILAEAPVLEKGNAGPDMG